MSKAIGMVELNSIARGIETCDYMVKAAQVDLIRSSTVCSLGRIRDRLPRW